MTENKEIKLTPDMLNLLGCNKENFLKLIELMDYKYFKKKEEIFLKYTPKKVKFKKEKTKKEFFLVKSSRFETHLLCLNKDLGVIITNGFLKFLCICLLSA